MTAVLIILASAAAVGVAFLVWHLTKNKKKGDKPAVSDVQASSMPVGDNNPTPPQEPPQEQVKEETYDTVFEGFLDCFSVIAEVERDTKTYDHLHMLFRETYSQFNDRKSLFGIPVIHRKENFPTLYQFGSIGDQKRGLNTIVGWVHSSLRNSCHERGRTSSRSATSSEAIRGMTTSTATTSIQTRTC